MSWVIFNEMMMMRSALY